MTLRIREPGFYTLVVDLGRPASRSLGVPIGGAADRASLIIGNALVGNPAEAAALEITLSGPTLEAASELACVVHGAPFELWSDRQNLTAGKTFTLQPGEILRIGAARKGMRAYLCVRGGLPVPVVLGSRSSLEPVRAGAEFACPPSAIHSQFISWQPRDDSDKKAGLLQAVAGPQMGWFSRDEFFGREFAVTPASNRMGLRLKGPPVCAPARELVSEPVCPGAVQVTRDGQVIILGMDGQTIGGYPKIAHVISADWDELGQLRPGDVVCFQEVSLETAEKEYRRRQEVLREWVRRLRLMTNS